MITILPYWLINIFFLLNLGLFLEKKIGIHNNSFFFSFINGLFALMTFTSFFSLFVGAYNFASHVVLSLFLLFVVWRNIKEFTSKMKVFIKIKLPDFKYLALIIFFVLLASSFYPLLQENDLYDIQTIKWAGEYGIVPGLINLHPLLAYFSPWHIVQAGMNPGLVIFNDINGMLLVIFGIYLLIKIKEIIQAGVYKFEDKIHIIYFLFYPFLLFFVSTPTIILPVVIFSQLSFLFFIKNYFVFHEEEMKQLSLLAIFTTSIAPSAFLLLFLPYILFIKHRKIVYKSTFLIYSLSILPLLFFLWLKNYILTGYLFYPLSIGEDIVKPDWQYPKELLDKIGMYINSPTTQIFHSGSIVKDILAFLSQNSPLCYFINFVTLSILILFPFFLKKHSHTHALKILYVIFILHIISMFLFQFKGVNFYFSLALFLLFVLLSYGFVPIKFNKLLFWNFSISALIILFLLYKSGLNSDYIYNPMHHTKIDNYNTSLKNNFIINYPEGEEFFWETGDAFLPAAQPVMLKWIFKMGNKNKYQLHLRERHIKKGFRTEKEE